MLIESDPTIVSPSEPEIIFSTQPKVVYIPSDKDYKLVTALNNINSTLQQIVGLLQKEGL